MNFEWLRTFLELTKGGCFPVTHFCLNSCSFHIFITLPLRLLARLCGLRTRNASLSSAAEFAPSSMGTCFCSESNISPTHVAEHCTTGKTRVFWMKQHCLFSHHISLNEDWSLVAYKAKGYFNLLLLRLIKNTVEHKAVTALSCKSCLSAVHI